MSFRSSALVAAAAVLGLGSITPASAQPQVPTRPRYTQFQSVFGGGRPLVANPGQGFLGQNAPGFVNPIGPNQPIFLDPALAYPQLAPGQVGATGLVDPRLAPTGVVATFNNLGHWYGNRSGLYGHWYPNGISSGAGVASNAGAYGGSGGGLIIGGGGSRPAVSSALGTTMLGAATVNQLRR